MTFRKLLAVSAICLATLSLSTLINTAVAETGDQVVSTPFKGPKANTGTVSFIREGSKSYLLLSSDFKIPDTPDPHWQVVDSKGEAHLLQALKVKNGLSNLRIEMPKHVPDVSNVVIWCAFAQVNLGEASFAKPVK